MLTLHDEKQTAARLGVSIRTLQQWRLLGTGPDRSLAVAVVSMSVQVKTFDQGIPSFIMKTSGASGSLSPEAPKQEF